MYIGLLHLALKIVNLSPRPSLVSRNLPFVTQSPLTYAVDNKTKQEDVAQKKRSLCVIVGYLRS